jgi:hypothetical protein
MRKLFSLHALYSCSLYPGKVIEPVDIEKGRPFCRKLFGPEYVIRR